jgi:site-specific recombinase XerD
MDFSDRPERGGQIAVQPIKDPKDIARIRKHLAGRPRDLAIFTMGINTNLLPSDLLPLTVGHVRVLRPGDVLFRYEERKTRKDCPITINKAVCQAVKGLLATMPGVQDTELIFQSRAGEQALTVSVLNTMVKTWCTEVKLKGNYGSHTLRKTFGYQHRLQHGTDITTLIEMFNHSSLKRTLSYLCIEQEEIKSIYMKEI